MAAREKGKGKEIVYMEMNVHHDKRTVDIWLTRKEAADDKFKESLNPIYKRYAEMNYFVSVFESGSGNLENGMIALLRHNIEMKARREVMAEKKEIHSR